MEPPPKRPRLQSADSSSENHSHYRSHVQSYHFDGQGFQNTGHIRVGQNLNIHSYGSTEKTKEEKQNLHREAVLDSLRFDQMDVRYMSVKRAHRETCQWFLSDPDYIHWLQREGTHEDKPKSLLWIKGKPGAGKSTLMKLLLHETRQARPEDTIISFFFNARGNNMEKSTVGLYQSLLVQLLKTDPALHNILDNYSRQENWSLGSLKTLFEAVVQNSRRTLICFIDALDECQESEIRDMLLFLSELTDARDNFYTCLASRHYPNISVKNGCSAVLENKVEHDKDIAKYLNSALQIGSGELADKIRSEVQAKASGVFMWVVLVVNILNRDCDKGYKPGFRKRLHEIPGDLNTLFHEILTRDTENEPGLLLCIQWVLFAAQPLSPRQLYYGIMAGLEPENLACYEESTNYLTDHVTNDDISKFLLDTSKGLTESTRSASPTIQFIHESVRDFLLDGKSLDAIWPGVNTDLAGRSHEALKRACHAFMAYTPMFSDGPLMCTVYNKVTFLDYACHQILYHANNAAKNNCGQSKFLDAFPLAKWVGIHNHFCVLDPPPYTLGVSLAYVLASCNLDALISSQNIDRSCFDVESEKYGTPLFAAIANRSINACRAIMGREIARQVPSQRPWNLDLSKSPNDACLQFFNRNFQFTEHGHIIFYLARAGDSQLLSIFCATQSFDINAFDPLGKTALSYAVEHGHLEVVEVLAEYGASPDLMFNFKTGTPLHFAIGKEHRSMIRLLVEKGASINAKDRLGWTALHSAASRGLVEEAELFINIGAEIDTRDEVGRTPCSLASFEGHIDVVRLLLGHGADMNAVDTAGQSSLDLAKTSGRTRVADLLVDRGAVS
ncbi:hypothetical protein PG991_013185 [Apiospora marii]|uniref:NACHT domain-containing protein n=1 Tax=Apiospora marii TaxID=335849 RepID=A0ABR1R5L5_9PEZI